LIIFIYLEDKVSALDLKNVREILLDSSKLMSVKL